MATSWAAFFIRHAALMPRIAVAWRVDEVDEVERVGHDERQDEATRARERLRTEIGAEAIGLEAGQRGEAVAREVDAREVRRRGKGGGRKCG